METGNHKSKRKKPNEYSVSPEEIKEKSEDLEKTINSSGINLHSAKGIFLNISGKKRTAVSICKIKTEAVEDEDRVSSRNTVLS